jgi:hypothetical protein
VTTTTNRPAVTLHAHVLLAELERKAERMPIKEMIEKLRGHLVHVADMGDDEYIIVREPRTAKGVAGVLAACQLVERLHAETDGEPMEGTL